MTTISADNDKKMLTLQIPAGVKQRARAKAWEAALQQPWGAPRRFAHTILALLAASTGKLDKYFMKNESLQDSIPCIQELFVKTLEACPAQASAVEETLELKPDDKKALLAALDSRVNWDCIIINEPRCCIYVSK